MSGDLGNNRNDDREGLGSAVPPLLERSAQLGFLGGMPLGDQVEHATGFAVAVEERLGRPPTGFLDLGTGGGLPGVVLAARWPSSRAVLFDANERRTAFLATEVDSWTRQPRVEVVRGRAEEAGHNPELMASVEVVVARSFAAPAVTAECAAPLVAVGGLVIISEPPDVGAGERWPSDGLGQLGLRLAESYRYRDRFSYQILSKVEPTPERYPRRVGIPTKRPLF